MSACLHACRFTWELIRSYRGRAAVVLTTHSMEEADVLGDDVVIMVSVLCRAGPQSKRRIRRPPLSR